MSLLTTTQSEPWVCLACTYNNVQLLECIMCGTARPPLVGCGLRRPSVATTALTTRVDNEGAVSVPIVTSSNVVLPPFPREIASGLVNLGNTCYMNAILQVFAHASQLCHAIDAECHIQRCHIALCNERRMRSHAREILSSTAACTGMTSGIHPDYEFCTLCEIEDDDYRSLLTPTLDDDMIPY